MKTIEDRVREMVEEIDSKVEAGDIDLLDVDGEEAIRQRAVAYEIICDLLEEHSPNVLDLNLVEEDDADNLCTVDLIVREIRRLQALDKKSDASS